jgi:hypothetical protein
MEPPDTTMTSDDDTTKSNAAPARDVPVDWEALEDAFENNAPEVHSYLHLATGDVLRVVDGVADPQMHARINGDTTYLRIAPVSSREQYRWMERYIPMVEDVDLRAKLVASIDGKGAFRRFKDVLMSHGTERERWFTFRSERLRTFMEAWLVAHAINAVPRPAWETTGVDDAPPSEESTPVSQSSPPPISSEGQGRRARSAEALRKGLRDAAESLGPRDLEALASFAEFLKARRIARAYAHHAESYEHHHGADDNAPVSSERTGNMPEPAAAAESGEVRAAGADSVSS